jgi:hypothetical protein
VHMLQGALDEPPQTLKEASAMAVAGLKTFGNAIDEFIDEYLDHPSKKMQQRSSRSAPR